MTDFAIDIDTSNKSDLAKIRVIGVGGGGGNAINNMIQAGLQGVDFIAANTDKQALEHNLAGKKIQIGKELTRGLGAGANPEIGEKAVEEDVNVIKEHLKDSDMIFVTAGMGGGTGTGGAPTIAKICRELNSLVVGIVTTPFKWEGRKRMKLALEGIERLRQYVDALIVIPNQKLLDIISNTTSFEEAFKIVDEVLHNATKGISEIIGNHGVINVDFADVRTIMKDMGDALMGIGLASGDDRAVKATENALNSPLLDGISIKGAQGVLVNISGGKNLTMMEISEALSIIEEEAGEDANIIHGVVQSREEMDEITITVVATGFATKGEEHAKKAVEPVTEELPFQINNGNSGFGGGMTGGTNRPPKPMPGLKSPKIKHTSPFSKGYTSFEQSPRGDEQLKKFDVPAFQRKNIKLDASSRESSPAASILANTSPNGNGKHSDDNY